MAGYQNSVQIIKLNIGVHAAGAVRYSSCGKGDLPGAWLTGSLVLILLTWHLRLPALGTLLGSCALAC